MGIALANRARRSQGQMTVELAVCIPVLIAVSLVVCNAMLFLENCASFDRLAKDAVRVYAASPAQGQSAADCAALVQESLSKSFSQDYLEVDVQCAGTSGGCMCYSASLRFRPTLFGRSFSGAVYDVFLRPLEHTTQLVLDPYKPGVLL